MTFNSQEYTSNRPLECLFRLGFHLAELQRQTEHCLGRSQARLSEAGRFEAAGRDGSRGAQLHVQDACRWGHERGLRSTSTASSVA